MTARSSSYRAPANAAFAQSPTALDGSDDPSATLHALLDQSLALAPEYGDGLSSHLPMALHALHLLGADSHRLHDFYGRYSTRLSPQQQQQPAAADAADAPSLGRIEDFARWRRLLARRLNDDGVDQVLREMLPVLARGSAGAAFHGLIRTGHAVRVGHAGELGAALAYWASRYHALPMESAEPLDLQGWLSGLVDIAKRHAGTWPSRDLITEEVADRATAPSFAEAASALDASRLLEVARLAALLYAQTRDFTVLHLVTSSEAATLLKPWMSPEVQQSIVPALAGGLLASGVLEDPRLDAWFNTPPDLNSVPGWPTLARQAVSQQDDHVMKLVAACRSLDASMPDVAWRAAASKALRT